MPLLSNRNRHRPRPLSRRDLSHNRLENFKKEVITDCHSIPLAQLCARLETNTVTGLTQQQAAAVLARTGPNTLTPATRTPEIVKFFRCMVHGFSILLWVGAALCYIAALVQFAVGDPIDMDNVVLGMVLIAVVLVTGCFTYFQENKSSKLMDTFTNMVPQRATVIRGGETLNIVAKEVVVGDLIDLKFGDQIPADVRIIKSQGFKVDNSCITGESEPLARTPDCTHDLMLETKNIAFFSTQAIEGTARGIVVACGDHTVIGRIAGLTTRIQPQPTPIARELRLFMHAISTWACLLGATCGLAMVWLRYTWMESALFLIGVIVANVPEGLLATVTVCLSVTAKRMAARNCLVKQLEAVETLGSTSVICSDKTGTLTQNHMTVQHVWCNRQMVNAAAVVDSARRYGSTEFRMLMRCATLCNRAEFVQHQSQVPIMSRMVRGDASEEAILKFIEMAQPLGSPKDFRDRNPKLVEVPFSSATKYQISVHALEGEGCLVVMKGAPERILEKCATILMDNKDVALTNGVRKTVDDACLKLAEKGERVLGFCDLMLSDRFTRAYPFSVEPPNFPQKGLRFLGFISLVDPPRPQVFDAVGKCRMAGIKVIMVTGDHPVTAKSIARDVGIITVDKTVDGTNPKELHSDPTETAVVIQGTTLREMSADEIDSILFRYREIVFARTSPTQKLQIVESLQRLGEIVAVTGDGVNDAPALKKADIGIAMGISGTEVSKQSADMILLDDNFASIVTGIEEGRRIFDNLKKSIAYTLASNVPEILPFLVFIILEIPLPLGIIAILCIDLLTDMLPAISLAYEKAESDIMSRAPRNPNRDNLVTAKLYLLAYGHIGMIEALAGFFTYFAIMAEHGFFPEKLVGLRKRWDSRWINDLEDSYGQEWSYEERKVLEYTCHTAFMISVVVTQWADLIICKTRRNSIVQQGMGNRVLIISLIIETAVACLLSYGPYMHYLKFYPVKLRWWCYSIPFATFMIMFDEFRKWHIRKYPRRFYRRETYY